MLHVVMTKNAKNTSGLYLCLRERNTRTRQVGSRKQAIMIQFIIENYSQIKKTEKEMILKMLVPISFT